MPEHTSFFSYLLEKFPALAHNIEGLKWKTAFGHPVTAHHFEPILASLAVILLIVAVAVSVRKSVQDYKGAIIPDEKLTMRNFLEVFIGNFYGVAKDAMGPERAKKYFPLIGTAAFFVFFSNILALIPGFLPPTSTWSITLGCAIVVFVYFNLMGLKENGLGYLKHLAGPVWWLAWLIFPLEVIALCLRPLTLSIRLMMNMAVDHLLLSIALGAAALFVPIPLMILGTLVIVVQTYVFALLTTIYIALATEHEEHGEEHGPDHAGDTHAHGAHAAKAQAAEAAH